MLESIVNTFKSFRDNIYHFFQFRHDAAIELVDSLSSNTTANSVVELSLSSMHRRNYCSITRVVREFYPKNSDKKSINDSLTEILTQKPCANNTKLFFIWR